MHRLLRILLLVAAAHGCGWHEPPDGPVHTAERPAPLEQPSTRQLPATVEEPVTPERPATAEQVATVVRQIDGDTVVLRGRGPGPLPRAPTRVRLLLVDAPEVHGAPACFGAEAARRLAELAPDGSAVTVRADRDRTDRYGRRLLHVRTAGGRDVGLTLVREGFATVRIVAPDRARAGPFEAAEREARQAGRGLWSACR